MSINELAGTVQLDFYFRLYWIDERLNIPSLWNAISTTSAKYLLADGAEIKGYIRDPGRPLLLWLPDIHFVDSQSVVYLEETIKIRPNGVMYWSRHAVITLQQPNFCIILFIYFIKIIYL